MADCGCEIEVANREQGRVLIILLLINACMFFIEIIFGIMSESSGLIADSLDMLADAAVYGIGWHAVGGSRLLKIKAAHLSGALQIILGVLVLLDAARRLVMGSEPESLLIISVGILAFVANFICFALISKHKEGEVHMRASWIFSKNDLIANVGIIVSGALVYLLDSRFPDLIIGMIISIIVVRGGLHIIKDANNEKKCQGGGAACSCSERIEIQPLDSGK